MLSRLQGHDAIVAKTLKLESVTFEPTKSVEPRLTAYETYADTKCSHDQEQSSEFPHCLQLYSASATM